MSVLIVGYGNALRGDDGAGPQVISALTADPRITADHNLQVRMQLAPELAVDFAAADLVVLVDAAVDDTDPGTVRLRRVQPGTTRRPTSHHLSPEAVLGLARALYGRCPRTYLITVTAADLRPGEPLSPPVHCALPRMITTVADVVFGTRSSSALFEGLTR
jgi:hydrogenase maturation protease